MVELLQAREAARRIPTWDVSRVTRVKERIYTRRIYYGGIIKSHSGCGYSLICFQRLGVLELSREPWAGPFAFAVFVFFCVSCIRVILLACVSLYSCLLSQQFPSVSRVPRAIILRYWHRLDPIMASFSLERQVRPPSRLFSLFSLRTRVFSISSCGRLHREIHGLVFPRPVVAAYL